MGDEKAAPTAFKSYLDDSIIETISFLPIEDTWKLLLMIGIGVFKNHKCIKYKEIMKKLAEQQKLFLIIADTDYIYGMNYQFCHGYIGKDLEHISQAKMIQAFGRIGRSNSNYNYSIRLRSDEMIKKVLKKEEQSIEIENMNRLFN